MPCNAFPIPLHIEAVIDTHSSSVGASEAPAAQFFTGSVAYNPDVSRSREDFWTFNCTLHNEKDRLVERPTMKINVNRDDFYRETECFVIWDVGSDNPRRGNMTEIDLKNWDFVQATMREKIYQQNSGRDDVVGKISFYMRAVYTPKGMVRHCYSLILLW